MVDDNENDHSNEDDDETGFRLDQDISLPKSKSLFYITLI
jgi:hypothetical protein